MQILELLDFEFTSTETSAASAVWGLTSLVFLIIGGLAGDRFSKPVALASFTVIKVAALAALFLSGSLTALYLSAALLGMSEGGRIPIRVSLLADYFGTNSFATILGLFGFFAGLLTVAMELVAPLVDGFLGKAGELVILAVVSLLGALCFLTATPPKLRDFKVYETA